MNDITFDRAANAEQKKEDIEWLRIWCDEVNDEKLPHVALIGDSITEGYYPFVKSALSGIARVDYLATSYSVASAMYQETVRNFVKDSAYATVHYNYGLHAYAVDEETYEICCRELIQFLAAQSRAVIATTTIVLDDTLRAEDPSWRDKVIARNEKLMAIAEELKLDVDDLNAVCKTFDEASRNPDGVHFTESGYKILADHVAAGIRKQLEQIRKI